MLEHTRNQHNDNAPDYSFDGGTAADRSDNDYDDPPNGRRLLIAKA